MGTHLYDCLNSFERMLEGHQELSKEVLKKFGGHVQCNRCNCRLENVSKPIIIFLISQNVLAGLKKAKI